MSRKASNIPFQTKRLYKIIASRQVEIPFFRGIARQRGRGFGALAQVLGELQFLFCLNILSQRLNVLSCWSLLHQKLLRLSVEERISRQLQRMCEDRLWQNSWVVVAGKRLQEESFQEILQNKSISREKKLLKTFLNNHVEQFLDSVFCGSFWKSWRKNSTSWRCLVVPETKKLSYYFTVWKLHRLWISNGSELLRWYETSIVGFET